MINTSKTERVLYASDVSIYEIIPCGVAFPKGPDEVRALLDIANRENVPLHPRGTGTSTVGQSLGNGISIDFSKHMNKIMHIDKDYVDVEPGITLGKLNSVLEKKGLFMPVDPSSMNMCSVGGMVSNNASGIHSFLYGDTKDHVLGLEGFWADGSFFSTIKGENIKNITEKLSKLHDKVQKLKSKLPLTKKNSSGYNIRDSFLSDGKIDLNKLLVGSEGSLCIITKLRLRVLELPKKRITLLSLFDDLEKGLEAVKLVRDIKGLSAIELFDEELISAGKEYFPELRDFFDNRAKAGLLFEIDGGAENFVEAQARELEKRLSSLAIKTEFGRSTEKRQWLWHMRRSAQSMLNRIHGSVQSLRFIDDVAVPSDSIMEFYKQEKKILDRYGLKTAFFGHIGLGNFHINPRIDTRAKDFMKTINAVSEETYALVKSLGGTFAAEHGDGILRQPYIKKFSPELHALFAEIKDIFDPKHILNSKDKIELRYGFTPKSNIKKEILDAVERCHGCNECIDFCTAFIKNGSEDEGCKARGRANLMRAIVRGSLDEKDMRTALHYIEACRLCGKCLTECPTGVNVMETASLLRESLILPLSLKKRFMMWLLRPLRSMLAKKINSAKADSVVNIDAYGTVIKLGLYYAPYTKDIINNAKNKNLKLTTSDKDLQKYLLNIHSL